MDERGSASTATPDAAATTHGTPLGTTHRTARRVVQVRHGAPATTAVGQAARRRPKVSLMWLALGGAAVVGAGALAVGPMSDGSDSALGDVGRPLGTGTSAGEGTTTQVTGVAVAGNGPAVPRPGTASGPVTSAAAAVPVAVPTTAPATPDADGSSAPAAGRTSDPAPAAPAPRQPSSTIASASSSAAAPSSSTKAAPTPRGSSPAVPPGTSLTVPKAFAGTWSGTSASGVDVTVVLASGAASGSVSSSALGCSGPAPVVAPDPTGATLHLAPSGCGGSLTLRRTGAKGDLTWSGAGPQPADVSAAVTRR